MKTPEIILIEAQLGTVRELTRNSMNHDLAALAAKREITLLRELGKARERAAAESSTTEGLAA